MHHDPSLCSAHYAQHGPQTLAGSAHTTPRPVPLTFLCAPVASASSLSPQGSRPSGALGYSSPGSHIVLFILQGLSTKNTFSGALLMPSCPTTGLCHLPSFPECLLFTYLIPRGFGRWGPLPCSSLERGLSTWSAHPGVCLTASSEQGPRVCCAHLATLASGGSSP